MSKKEDISRKLKDAAILIHSLAIDLADHPRAAAAMHHAHSIIFNTEAAISGSQNDRIAQLRELAHRTDWYGARSLSRDRISEAQTQRYRIGDLIEVAVAKTPIALAIALDELDREAVPDSAFPPHAVDWMRDYAIASARQQEKSLFHRN